MKKTYSGQTPKTGGALKPFRGSKPTPKKLGQVNADAVRVRTRPRKAAK